MRPRFNSSRVLTILALSLTALFFMGAGVSADGGPKGLNSKAAKELRAAGVDKYLGQFAPSESADVGDGWTQHTFDADEGNGPICIDGSDYSVFTRAGDPEKLLILLQGGGACWDSFYRCTENVPQNFPPFPQIPQAGIWDRSSADNPLADYSVVYMPYCDGSVFGGDNAVEDDPRFDIRHHRGLRNLSAGMDVARAEFKRPEKIVVAGSSAGGVGAAAFAPFLARFTYGNSKELFVFNDAGPIVVNLGALDAVEARALDWGFEQFYPASCTECSAFGQQTAIVDWRLDNDSTIREAFYETDADATNIGFACANLPGFFDPLPPAVPFDITLFDPPFNLGCAMSQSQYRALFLEGVSVNQSGAPFRYDDAHDALNAAHPDRYRRFIVSGDTSHTALQSIRFYVQTADGVPLNEWTGDFIEQPGQDSVWVDIVEEFDELP